MRWSRSIRVVTLAAATMLATACALKDPPARSEFAGQALPAVQVPDNWGAPATAGAVAEPWLASFQDARLEVLVGEALAHNPDLTVAAARVEQATAALKAAGAQLGPSVNAFGKGGGKLGGDFSGTSGVLLRATWELDVWGRLRYGRRAVEETYLSTEVDFAGARQSLAAMVAKGWFLAIESRQPREIARQMVGDAEKSVALAEDRLRIGAGNELDATLAKQTLQTARDSAAQIDLALQNALRAIETLIGRYPSAQLETPQSFDPMPDDVPAGLPSELLERRLDVQAAEHRIAAAFSQVEEARTAKLPTFSLSAGLSHITSDLFVLDRRDDIVKSVG